MFTMRPSKGEPKHYDTQEEAERGARGLLNLGRIRSADILHGSHVVAHLTKKGKKETTSAPKTTSAKTSPKPKKDGAKPKSAGAGAKHKRISSKELFAHIRKMAALGYDGAQISRDLHKQLGKTYVVTSGD